MRKVRLVVLMVPGSVGRPAVAVNVAPARDAGAVNGPEMRHEQNETGPLKYRFTYVDRIEPEFVPAALAFGSGIHGAAALLFRSLRQKQEVTARDLQGFFESFWMLETRHRPVRFTEKETMASLLALGKEMLGVLFANVTPGTEIVAVEQAFKVPLIDPETGEVLERDLVGSLDLLERDPRGLVVVDLKTATRRYSDVHVEASLQLTIYSYATAMLGFVDQEDLRLRFDVLTMLRSRFLGHARGIPT